MPARHQNQVTSRTRIPTKRLVALVVLAIAVAFIVQNRQTVNITLFLTSATGPLWAALAAVLIFGIACGYLLAYRRRK